MAPVAWASRPWADHGQDAARATCLRAGRPADALVSMASRPWADHGQDGRVTCLRTGRQADALVAMGVPPMDGPRAGCPCHVPAGRPADALVSMASRPWADHGQDGRVTCLRTGRPADALVAMGVPPMDGPRAGCPCHVPCIRAQAPRSITTPFTLFGHTTESYDQPPATAYCRRPRRGGDPTEP